MGNQPERWLGDENKTTRKILKGNFFGAEEWASHGFVSVLAKQHLLSAMNFPWDEETLSSPCKFISGKTVGETHFAFLGIKEIFGKPLTIAECVRDEKFGISYRNRWYDSEPFFRKQTCEVRWYMMPIAAGLTSSLAGRSYIEQKAMLGEYYEVSTAVELVVKNALYKFLRGVFPDSLMYLRCRNGLLGNIMQIKFCKEGLDIKSRWAGSLQRVAISASRKLPSVPSAA